MTNSATNAAREYFTSKGLTYSDITAGDICVLTMLLNKHIKAANKQGKMSTNTMHMSEKVDCKYKSNGTLVEGYLYINSHYFTRREAISFNKDGFIGFCGWADENNTAPIVAAFIEWCEVLTEQKAETEGTEI
jgi:hypothetical protein